MSAAEHADTLREQVRDPYASTARQATACGCANSCCGPATGAKDPAFGAALYTIGEQEELPQAALLGSLGCGNPTAVAELQQGETVLDLGSGGGIDVLLSARRVGPTGKATAWT